MRAAFVLGGGGKSGGRWSWSSGFQQGGGEKTMREREPRGALGKNTAIKIKKTRRRRRF